MHGAYEAGHTLPSAFRARFPALPFAWCRGWSTAGHCRASERAGGAECGARAVASADAACERTGVDRKVPEWSAAARIAKAQRRQDCGTGATCHGGGDGEEIDLARSGWRADGGGETVGGDEQGREAGREYGSGARLHATT